MTLTISEQILVHTSFSCLFLVTFIYWSKFICVDNEALNVSGRIGMIIAFICITGFLLTRWTSSKQFPLSNLYESAMFLSWSLTLIHLIVENRSRSIFMSIITAPSAMLAHGFATLGLPLEMQESIPLVPALQSHWSIMHVTMMILSYATLLCGSLLAITLLIVTATKRKNFELFKIYTNSFFDSLTFWNRAKTIENNINSDELQKNMNFFVNFRKWQLIEESDNWSYRIISSGFPLLTIGILSGAVWANEAWGSYWNWDPKETWALITWLIFAIYLHTRMTRSWRGKRSAFIASLGFYIIWICYLGVNLLGKGLHSYGWIV
uniref:cytochrome c heme attachment protein n=1 Tax=Pallavicinia lyellii TaxID=56939 RepID=UPI001D1186C2|nr:cytochrome c heme attachment protein [Pallavicinia lyellii]QZZ24684.1 cytochrome c heme attachment protein [Pallavicinia lyellii]QZZ24768.1 cytochrome c heme attachment protein [Pallavicinia lyellii]